MQDDQSHAGARAGAVGAPDFSAEKWNLLDPGIKTLWVLGNLIGLVIVVAVGIGLDVIFRLPEVAGGIGFRLYPGLLGLLFVLVFGALPFILIGLKYKNTLYLVSEDEVCIRSGIWWKSERYVPRARIQYVDVSSGPIERHLGLATLAVYVGGQAGAGANIAGLKAETAEALRRELVAELPERQAAEVEPPPIAGDVPPPAEGGTSEAGAESTPSNPWAGSGAVDESSEGSPSNPWAGSGAGEGSVDEPGDGPSDESERRE